LRERGIEGQREKGKKEMGEEKGKEEILNEKNEMKGKK
jgi:hypothetical protein